MKQLFFHFLLFIITASAIFSCTVVKKYKPGEPFIYENTVKIKGITNKEKETDIRERLEKQIEDSVMVNSVPNYPGQSFRGSSRCRYLKIPCGTIRLTCSNRHRT